MFHVHVFCRNFFPAAQDPKLPFAGPLQLIGWPKVLAETRKFLGNRRFFCSRHFIANCRVFYYKWRLSGAPITRTMAWKKDGGEEKANT
jgi:hypothetical protein